ncbi:MAG TPA: hypothetical protein VHT24_02495, partial [Pseudacidobacterium sp.]|nr:hypothetical protein [Pseudacidobacterium sp.]
MSNFISIRREENNRDMRYVFCVMAVIGAAAYLAAQANHLSKPITPEEVPVATLEFNSPEQTPLGRQGTVMSAEQTCAEDGTLFVEIADSLEDLNLVLHALKGPTEDTRFLLRDIQGYENVSPPLRYFVNDHNVAVLVEAELKKNLLQENAKSASKRASLVLIFDRKGTFQRTILVPNDIDAKAVGLYSSGDILIVALDRSTK